MIINKLKLTTMVFLCTNFFSIFPTHALNLKITTSDAEYLKEKHKKVILNAVTRLEDIILTDHTIDIKLSIKDVDGKGGTLAYARPVETVVNYHNHLSYTTKGEITIDRKDLKDPGLYNITTHEMIHALGFGTLWKQNNLLAIDSNDKYCYIGEKAVKVYSNLTGRKQSFIPLQTTGGSGTAGAHWSEEIFFNELMTGYYNSNIENPLSKLTLAAFEDLGYEVDYSQADTYSLPLQGQASMIGYTSSRYRHPYCGCNYSTSSQSWCSIL